jgi:hypothetical protein
MRDVAPGAPSDPINGERRIEPPNVFDIAGDDGSVLALGRENYRGVDDVGRSGAAAENARRLGQDVIERRHGGRWSSEQATQQDLSLASAPNLADDACGDHQLAARAQRFSQERPDALVRSLERGERSGV